MDKLNLSFSTATMLFFAISVISFVFTIRVSFIFFAFHSCFCFIAVVELYSFYLRCSFGFFRLPTLLFRTNSILISFTLMSLCSVFHVTTFTIFIAFSIDRITVTVFSFPSFSPQYRVYSSNLSNLIILIFSTNSDF